MHVVVTGGTGLIGSHLVDRLRERGDGATVVSRHPEGPSQIGWDPSEPGSLTLPDATDAVVHLAGAPIVGTRWTENYKREIRDSRVEGTERVVEAITQHGEIDHLVSGSAVGYYGDRGDERLDESAPPGEDFMAGVAEAWEDRARQLGAKSNIDTGVARIRTATVLDDEEGALPEMLNPVGPIKPFHWGLGGPVGSGEQWFPWIHIDDEVRAILHILDERLAGAFNLVAPGIVRNKRFTKAIGDTLDRPAKLPVPEFALRMMYGEAADVLFVSQHVVPERLEETNFTFRYPEVQGALEDLIGPGEGGEPETPRREPEAVA
jgi:uncharacterized protein (TIGR01777 family)